MMDSVIVVEHRHRLPDDVEEIKMIGVYRPLGSAHAAVNRLRNQPGFCNSPNVIVPSVTHKEDGFYVDEYHLDDDHWIEGFVTLAGSGEYDHS